MKRPVLIVDDSAVARLSIKGALKESGATVAEASCGEDALGLIEGGMDPSMVFLDLTMPGMGGIETMRALRGRKPSLKVVVVTADTQSLTLEELRALGAFAIVRKPAPKHEIVSLYASAGRSEP